MAETLRVFKGSCEVDKLHTAPRLERALAIYGLIAWRAMLLGRTADELDAEVFYTEMELRACAQGDTITPRYATDGAR